MNIHRSFLNFLLLLQLLLVSIITMTFAQTAETTAAAATATATATDTTTTTTTLVLGGTGATGKWVVKQLLDMGQNVRVIVRSKERMITALKEINTVVVSDDDTKLTMIEDSLLDMSDSDLQSYVLGCDAVVSCLGHNLNIEGLWGKKGRRLVTDTVKRVTDAMIRSAAKAATDATTPAETEEPVAKTTKPKFILMGSDGVANPNGQDDPRTMMERFVLSLLRCLVPPHVDNEEAAAYVYHSLPAPATTSSSVVVEWSVVRPTDLIDGPPTPGRYQLHDKPIGGLFGAGVATRSNVAHSMVELIVNDTTWEQYKFRMPVLHDIVVVAAEKTPETTTTTTTTTTTQPTEL